MLITRLTVGMETTTEKQIASIVANSLRETGNAFHVSLWLDRHFSGAYKTDIESASDKAARLRAEAEKVEREAASRLVEDLLTEWSIDEMSKTVSFNRLNA